VSLNTALDYIEEHQQYVGTTSALKFNTNTNPKPNSSSSPEIIADAVLNEAAKQLALAHLQENYSKTTAENDVT
jgi:hypothetical protein